MSLKAGRVGVAPDQVDEFGKIKSEATSGYTKQEADVKFETKTHAGNTYQKKTLELPLETLLGSKLTVEDSLDALNEIQKTRQPKTLEVPISMLIGSQLVSKNTVEEVILTMDGGIGLSDLTERLRKRKVTPEVDGTILKSFVTTGYVEYDLITRICNFSFIVRMGTFSHNQPSITGMPKAKSNASVICQSSSSTTAPVLGFSIAANGTSLNCLRIASAQYIEDVDYFVTGSYIIADDVLS